MKKLRWNNIIKSFIFLITLYIVIHDIYIIFISQYFTGYLATWTYVGFITFAFSLYYTIDFIEEFKKDGRK